MRKRIVILFFVLFFGLVIFRPKTYSVDGKELFISKCGMCHKSGNAPDFAPVKKASIQWERFFTRKKHRRGKGKKPDISGKITLEEEAVIKQYLIDHAADSDLPIAAGIR